jgi:DNA-damage-inducible protein D
MDLFPTFSEEHFENNSKENGFTFWYASELMTYLGYANMKTFTNAINKAIATCTTLQIPIMDNFFQFINELGEYDYKLSRFACYLVVMNSDTRKEPVAKAQAYFAALAGAVQNFFEETEKIDRLAIREEIAEREKSLAGTAKTAKVTNYAFFQNAGYRGLYNLNMEKLKAKRNVPTDRSLLDFMGKEELAANLFRITQTELKIKNENITGQNRLEVTAENVGKMVRKSMQEISGIMPENLPVKDDIKQVKKELKQKSKTIKAIDAKKKKKK